MSFNHRQRIQAKRRRKKRHEASLRAARYRSWVEQEYTIIGSVPIAEEWADIYKDTLDITAILSD